MDNEGSIDLCLLGFGHNGHLGLIEPSEQIMPHWHLADLSSSSLDHSMLQKFNARPSFGITLVAVPAWMKPAPMTKLRRIR